MRKHRRVGLVPVVITMALLSSSNGANGLKQRSRGKIIGTIPMPKSSLSSTTTGAGATGRATVAPQTPLSNDRIGENGDDQPQRSGDNGPSTSVLVLKEGDSSCGINGEAPQSVSLTPREEDHPRSSLMRPQPLTVLQLLSFLQVASSALVAFAPAPALIAALGAEKAAATLSGLTACAAIAEIGLSSFVGSALDSFGRKPILLSAALATALTNGVAASRPSVLAICIARFVGMLSVGAFMVASQAAMSDILAGSPSSDPARLSAAMGTQKALNSGAFFAGSLVAGRLSDLGGRHGLSASYGSSAILGMVSAALVNMGMPETLGPSNRRPFDARAVRRLLVQSPLSCGRLLLRRGAEVRTLAVLLLLQTAPLFMGDFLQILAREDWNLSTKNYSSFVAMWGVAGMISNAVGSQLVRRLGVRRFTTVATVSSLAAPIGAAAFGFRGLLVGTAVGFLASAQSVGISAALVSRGNESGASFGELAGERSSLMALLKVVGPVLYSALYVHGERRLATKHLPFMFNIVLAAAALITVQLRL